MRKTPNIICKADHLPWIIALVFFVINTIQGIFTPLLNDESYYWFWSLKPAFGYFDHPPMIAWIIKAGTTLFKNEFGVRFFPILMGSGTVFLLADLLKPSINSKNDIKIFALIIFSSVFLALYTFIAIIDTPLLFFSTLFLWQFKRYLENDSVKNSIILGIISALLLYSKYHGILVIGFAFLSQPQYFKKKSFYITFISGLLLFIPHLYWLYKHDFVTVHYHLVEKGNLLKKKYVFNYIKEQLAVTGPVILLLFTILRKPKSKFERSLKFICLGTFIFFFISSFRGKINCYWTLVTCPSMIYLSFNYLKDNVKHQKWTSAIMYTLSVVVLLLKINLITYTVPIPHINNWNPKKMAETFSANTDRPLIFVNSFISPTLYMFYTGNNSYSINNIKNKRTQLNFEKELEKSFYNKPFTLVSYRPLEKFDKKIEVDKGRTYYLQNFEAYKERQTSLHVTCSNIDIVKNKNTTAIPVNITGETEQLSNTDTIWFTMKNRNTGSVYEFKTTINKQSSNMEIPYIKPTEPGIYKCCFSITNNSDINFRILSSSITILHIK